MTTFDLNQTTPVLTELPPEARDWLTSLPWQQRRYVLSLCHLVCATPSAQQAEFLDAYTAEGLLSRIVDDTDMRQRVNEHLSRFRSEAAIDDETVRKYIRQMYVHSVQDAQHSSDLYVETALMLMGSAQEHSSVLSYILGFEILKLLFSMSWEQHERLYHLQPDQDDFTREYIRPVQDAHKQHGIVKPKDSDNFFARREYFVKIPNIHPKRMIKLVIEAFSADKIISLGFSILRHPNAIHYDYDYIYTQSDGLIEDSVQQMREPRASLKAVTQQKIKQQKISQPQSAVVKAETKSAIEESVIAESRVETEGSTTDPSAEVMFEQLFNGDEAEH